MFSLMYFIYSNSLQNLKGPASELSKYNIPLIKDLPDVGKNLRDHLCVLLSFKDLTDTVYQDETRKPLRVVKEIVNYALYGTGALATCGIQTMSFHKTNTGAKIGVNRPNAPDMYVPTFPYKIL
jgi:choline dehydrogenase-like flavoprotein